MKLTKEDKAKSKALYSKMVDVPHVEPSRLDLQATDYPDIKKWEVGKTYEIKLKAKMISRSEGGWDGKQPLRASFEFGGTNDNESSEPMMDMEDDD